MAFKLASCAVIAVSFLGVSLLSSSEASAEMSWSDVKAMGRIPPGSPKIVCGTNGCFEVRPGCTAELRRIGRGEVALVFCKQK